MALDAEDMKQAPKHIFVPPPDTGTDALLEYLWASRCDLWLFHFVIDTALRGDFVAHIARQALDGKNRYKAETPEQLASMDPGPATTALRQSSQELLEMFVSRIVDNFEVYLVALIRLVLHKEPRILSDRKQEITLGHILKFDSIEALSRDIIEGKLSALSYQGFAELEAWCTQRSIPLLVPHGQRERVVELIALRNIIVHNRGRVDERYRAAVPESSIALGGKRKLGADDLFGAVALLDSVVVTTDAAVSGKFRLPTTSIREEIQKRGMQRWPKRERNAQVDSLDPPAIES
jgi:hypothetical protein